MSASFLCHSERRRRRAFRMRRNEESLRTYMHSIRSYSLVGIPRANTTLRNDKKSESRYNCAQSNHANELPSPALYLLLSGVYLALPTGNSSHKVLKPTRLGARWVFY